MDEISALLDDAATGAAEARTSQELSAVETRVLGSKGRLQALMAELRHAPPEERRSLGARLNDTRVAITTIFAKRKEAITAIERERRLEAETVDVTLPGLPVPRGRSHPLSTTTDRIKEVLIGLGFEFFDGPELEDYAHNFAALNYPEEHPAFDEQMTFYINDDRLLRTQTTAIQGRAMRGRKPPLRIATVGRCFRYEAVDATHHHTFHQVDVFMVDHHVSLADLKGILKAFASAMFGGDVEVRFRPDYFPFVEPGVDYSIYWRDRWLELGGAGLIHPNILAAHGFDPEVYSGFAFGLGVERIHMIRHGVTDLRDYLNNDLRFLWQF